MVNMLHTWVEKIQSNDAHQVTNLYHQNGILLGTFSDIERIGKDLIFDYFKDLLKSKVDVEIITQHESKTESIYTVSGLYNFMVDGKKIEARFSFVFLKVKTKWKIISHHSSTKPDSN